MPWTLQSPSQKIELAPGRTVTIGRTPKAEICFPEDEWMSSLHFAVGVSGGGLHLQNLSQTNGTLVNDQRTEATTLAPGDKITAGQSTFLVGGPKESPFPAKVRLGGWGFAELPQDWQPVEGVGYRLPRENEFCATITAVEEPLPKETSLQQYVDAQMALMRERLPQTKVEASGEMLVRGAEKALALTVTTGVQNGTVIQHQIYAASARVVGIFTATILDRQEASLRDTIARIVAGLSYFQG